MSENKGFQFIHHPTVSQLKQQGLRMSLIFCKQFEYIIE